MDNKEIDTLKIKSDSVEKTCSACPSQWEAETVDDRFVYVRYRWGVLRVELADSKDDWWGRRGKIYYCSEEIGGPFDGEIDWDEVRETADITEV